MGVINNRSLSDNFKVKDRSPGYVQSVKCCKCNGVWNVPSSMDIGSTWQCPECTREEMSCQI